MKKSLRNRSLLASVKVAIFGIGYAFSTQRNMKTHGIASVLAVSAGLFFGISRWEWAYLSLSTFLVLIAEILNTSIELTIDLVTRKTKARAMLAKDLAAGAVLMAALQALTASYLIFFDRFVNLVR